IFTKSVNKSRFYFRSRLGIFIPEARSFLSKHFPHEVTQFLVQVVALGLKYYHLSFAFFFDIERCPFGLESPSMPSLRQIRIQLAMIEGSCISNLKATS